MSGRFESERTWGLLRDTGLDEALRFAALSVTCCESCRTAAQLAVSELAENSLKYSARSSDARAGSIGISVKGRELRIRSSNIVASSKDAQAVIDLIAEITPKNAAVLFRKRLEVLFKDASAPRAGLGMLRLAFEGGFRLSSFYRAPQLEITAERTCSKSR